MSDWIPDAPDTRSLGSTTREWLNMYIGDAGRIYFGLSQDCDLYRAGANILQTNDNLRVVGGYIDVDQIRSITDQLILSGNVLVDSPFIFRNSNAALDNYVTRLRIYAAADQGNAGITSYEPVTVYKSAGGVLLTLQATAANSYAEIDLTNDAQTWRISVAGAEGDTLRIYNITGAVQVAYFTTAGQLQLSVQGSSGGLLIGGDTLLYRSAADLLYTPDVFQAGGYKSSDGTAGATGTITLASTTTITVKDGLITAWS